MLKIDLQTFSREKAHATYSSFFVDNEANKYKLKLGTFKGTKGLGMFTMDGKCLSLFSLKQMVIVMLSSFMKCFYAGKDRYFYTNNHCVPNYG